MRFSHPHAVYAHKFGSATDPTPLVLKSLPANFPSPLRTSQRKCNRIDAKQSHRKPCLRNMPSRRPNEQTADEVQTQKRDNSPVEDIAPVEGTGIDPEDDIDVESDDEEDIEDIEDSDLDEDLDESEEEEG